MKTNQQILRDALKRIADPRNTHFSGDAQVVAQAALAATAPESAPADAPVYQYRQKAGVNEWIECDSRCEARMKLGPAAGCFEYRTLYTHPAPSQSQSADQVRDAAEKMQAARAALSDMFQAVEAYEDACNKVGGDPDQFWTKAKEAADRAHQWLLLDVQPCLERQRVLATSSAAKGD